MAVTYIPDNEVAHVPDKDVAHVLIKGKSRPYSNRTSNFKFKLHQSKVYFYWSLTTGRVKVQDVVVQTEVAHGGSQV